MEVLVIGCIHLLPMPNTPYYKSGDLERSVEKRCGTPAL